MGGELNVAHAGIFGGSGLVWCWFSLGNMLHQDDTKSGDLISDIER